MKRTSTVLGILTALALLAGCGDGNGTTDTPDGVDNGDTTDGIDNGDGYTLVTREFSFTPDSLTVSADTDVTVTVDNSSGVVEHDFTLDEADVRIHANPGQTESGTFSVPAGTYTFYCSVPGHREAGMEGTLVAE